MLSAQCCNDLLMHRWIACSFQETNTNSWRWYANCNSTTKEMVILDLLRMGIFLSQVLTKAHNLIFLFCDLSENTIQAVYCMLICLFLVSFNSVKMVVDGSCQTKMHALVVSCTWWAWSVHDQDNKMFGQWQIIVGWSLNIVELLNIVSCISQPVYIFKVHNYCIMRNITLQYVLVIEPL